MEPPPDAAGELNPDAAFSQFPAPPAFYRLYADGPAAGPPPPLPVRGELHVLGEPFNTDEPFVPPLDVPRLYSVGADDGAVDIKGELLRLNRALPLLFVELLAVLVQQPSAYAHAVTQILVALHNMSHLINLARPLQAQATVLASMRAQVDEKRAAAAALRARAAEARADVLALARQLADVGRDAAESAPRGGGAAGGAAGSGAAGAAGAAVGDAMEEG